jgi:hypothetical protein
MSDSLLIFVTRPLKALFSLYLFILPFSPKKVKVAKNCRVYYDGIVGKTAGSQFFYAEKNLRFSLALCVDPVSGITPTLSTPGTGYRELNLGIGRKVLSL